MARSDSDDLERIDREIRINELKHQAEELAGGEMLSWEADDCPANLAEQFWEQVVAYEKAPSTTHFHRLHQAGVALPLPDKLSEKQLNATLWEVIHALAEQRVFLHHTNHLSDRELYTALHDEVLHEVFADLPIDDHALQGIDLVGSGSEEHILLHLKYYADSESRRHWQEGSEYEMPPHEDPPFDRDRLLPKEAFGSQFG